MVSRGRGFNSSPEAKVRGTEMPLELYGLAKVLRKG